MSELRCHIVELYAFAIKSTPGNLFSYYLDPRPLTLKTFSTMCIHMWNIYDKFHRNLYTKYRYTALCKIV